MQQLFVYGTLRKGGPAHHLLGGSPLLAQGVGLRGFSLYSAGWYPVAVLDRTGSIIGDIVSISEARWPILDAYEGDAYERYFMQEQGLWLYRYQGPPNNMPLVAGGDWLRWVKQKG
jgi:gamma-glutamylaminecyclotransferase